MTRTIFRLLIIGFAVCVGSQNVDAQSNFNLMPPAIGTSLRFACAESQDGRVRIIRTASSYEAREIGAADKESDNDQRLIKIEQEEQPLTLKKVGDTTVALVEYTVSIPFVVSVTVDGRTVQETRIRSETRKRQVPIQDPENKKMIAYKIQVPFTQSVTAGGKTTTLTKLRPETRTRFIDKDQELFQVLTPLVSEIGPDKLKFFDLKGNQIEPTSALEKLEERTPVVLVDSEEPSGDFFDAILKPETILIFDKENSIK